MSIETDHVDEASLKAAINGLLETIADMNSSDESIETLEVMVREKMHDTLRASGENPFELISTFTAGLSDLFVNTHEAVFCMTVMAVMGMMCELECMHMRGETANSYFMFNP